VGRGLVERVLDWRQKFRQADLVLLGSNGKFMREIDSYSEQYGVPVIGAGADAAKLELDRLFGMAAFKRCGIPVPPFRQFSNIDQALDYVAKRDEGGAVKPCGDVTDKSLSFVGKDGRELAWRLQSWKREGKKFPDGLLIQDRIEGVEFAVGAWVGPNGFCPGWEENFEEKKLFAGHLGPNCGEAGTVMRLVDKSKLASKVLAPCEDLLVRLGYVGNVDVNCIVDSDGNPWPLEWTVRFGYPAIDIEMALHDGDPIEYLAGVAEGKPPKTRILDQIAVGVVMALPPYPFGHEKTDEVVEVPIWEVTSGMMRKLHFAMVAAGEAPLIEGGKIGKTRSLVTAGSYVMVATGVGDSVVKARGQAMRLLDRVRIPASPFWRVDIGQRLRAQLPELRSHGYATGMVYA
jgi:phosphoribosylamine--glycine ligase